jgi:hypothetical protein
MGLAARLLPARVNTFTGNILQMFHLEAGLTFHAPVLFDASQYNFLISCVLTLRHATVTKAHFVPMLLVDTDQVTEN